MHRLLQRTFEKHLAQRSKNLIFQTSFQRYSASSSATKLPRNRERELPRSYATGHSRPIRPVFTSRYAVLRSSIHHATLVFVVGIAVAATVYLSFSSTGDDSKSPLTDFDMSSSEIPSGHLGNLSPEQEQKLRKFWLAIADVCGWAEDGSTSIRDTTKDATTAAAEADSGKWRFGLFRKTESTGAGHPDALGNASDDDKFGLTKQFNEVLAKQSPESIRETIWGMVKHDHPDALALRFLRARKWDVQKALVMFISAMNWRQSEMHVDDDIMKNGEEGAALNEKGDDAKNKKVGHDFLEQLRMGKSFLHGVDKEGRPICVVRVRLHRNGDQCAESIERYTVHIIETARLLLLPPVETATIVFDMTSFTLANMDYAPVKFMIKCFEANYPESLGAVLIHNAPWVFQGIWRIIRGWLDPVVAAKVHFTNGRSGLEEFIEPSKIIKELGGDEEWEYKYEEPVAGENKTMEDAASKEKILEQRATLVKEFQEATKAWIRTEKGDDGKQAANRRDELANQMRANYWQLDPYVRAKSIYDRQRMIKAGGSIEFYLNKE